MKDGTIGEQPLAIHKAHGRAFHYGAQEDAYDLALASAAAAVGSSEIKVVTLLDHVHGGGVSFTLLVGTDEAFISVAFGDGQPADVVAIMRSWADIDRVDVRATDVKKDTTEARSVAISIRDSPQSGTAHELKSSEVPKEQIAKWLDLARSKLLSR